MKISITYWKKALFLSIFLVVLIASWKDAFYSYELPLLDLRFRLRGRFHRLAPLAIIEIDNATLQSLGTWPIKRNFYALLLKALHKVGVRAVVFDIFFSEPTRYDLALSQAMKDNAKVYLPLVFEVGRSAAPLASAQRIIAGERKEFLSAALGVGHINTYADRDGKIRAVPLFIRYKNKMIPQLSLKVAADLLSLRLQNVRAKKDHLVIDNKLILPLDEKGRFIINYAGEWGTFVHYSFLDILKSYQIKLAGEKPQIDLRCLKDKVCFVGLTASGTTDIRATPLNRNYPQVGVLANVFNSIYLGRFIKDEPKVLRVVVSLVLALLGLFFSLRFSLAKGLGYLVGLFFLYIFSAFLLFVKFGIWLRIFLPLGFFFVFYLIGAIWRTSQEIKRRQMLEKELEIARNIQKSFLPQEKKNPPSLEVEAFFQPARFVAGDLYDFYPLGESRYGIFIADVSGKGVPAALIMAQTVTLFRLLASEFSPAEVLEKINRQLCKMLKGKFVTALYLVYDASSKRITVCSAGHAPLAIYRASKKEIEFIDPNAGPPLGILSSVTYADFSLSTEKGDVVVLYTDGVTEARNRKREDFGEERLTKVLRVNAETPLGELRDKISQEILGFSQGAKQHDDITFILIKFLR